MKTLIEAIKKIKIILNSLEDIFTQEYHNLSNSETSNENLLYLIEKKTSCFKKLTILSQDRLSLEKKIGIFAPYQNHYQLNNYWNQIIKKCIFLKRLNLKNKILLNKKFYLNQHFLELFPSHKTAITYNLNGDLKN
ncbi:flagellar biosynthesis protein FlgN [Buchnera aphidicola (Sitobion avenae)]|uniref:Flagellar biosynthesis protein FlgN n=1 Tax=Buchnera aphidicola (Sitobion avenae) TaxID=571428 RepID=A0A4D6Y8J9_9GAMM|nr:flagellar export chaperone FlgN [Buchnera aphidicola]QCI25542.1 flagellar biosynthesis protein FlgN [Buchnera aphidicola (Sitobion avenae)]